MEAFLAVCTLLGGASAVWFFWDKIVFFMQKINFVSPDKNINILSLSDDEFMLVDKLLKFPNPKEYLPTSPNESIIFNSLVNQGYFTKSNNDSYVPTKKFKTLSEKSP